MRLGIGTLMLGLAALSTALPADAIKDLQYGTPEVREAALDEVLAGRAPGAGPALLGLLSEAQGTLKLKVLRALGLLREPKAVKPLLGVLADPAAEFRLSAVKSLGRIGSPDAVDGLVAATKDADDEVREAAALALAECGNADSSKALLTLLKDKNRLVRLAAVDGLGRLGSEASLPALEGQLSDSDPAFQRHVFKAIGSLKSAKALPFLQKGLASKDPYVRGFSAEALAARPREAGMEKALLTLLGDDVLAVRIRALEALAAWKSRAAVPAMVKALQASEPTLRWKAAKALGRIGDPKAREALDYVAQNDAEPEIKASAAQALTELR